MWITLLFASTLAYFGLRMAYSPEKWSEDICRFGRWRYFHLFEICSRIIVGLLFFFTSDNTNAPLFFTAFGLALVSVGVGLTFYGEERHRQFAQAAGHKYQAWFRPGGLIALFISLLLVNYSGLFASII